MKVYELLNNTINQSKIMIEWLSNKIKDNQEDLDSMNRAKQTVFKDLYNTALVKSELCTELVSNETGIDYHFCREYIEKGMDWEDPFEGKLL